MDMYLEWYRQEHEWCLDKKTTTIATLLSLDFLINDNGIVWTAASFPSADSLVSLFLSEGRMSSSSRQILLQFRLFHTLLQLCSCEERDGDPLRNGHVCWTIPVGQSYPFLSMNNTVTYESSQSQFDWCSNDIIEWSRSRLIDHVDR